MRREREAAARAVIEEALAAVLDGVVEAFDAGFAQAIQAGRTEDEASVIAGEAASGAPSWAWVHRDGSWRVGAYRVERFGYGRDEVPREAGYVLCLTLDDFLEGGAPCSPDMIDSLREIGSNQVGDLVDDQLVEALCVEWQKSEEG